MSFPHWLRPLSNAIAPVPVERQLQRSTRRLGVECLEDRRCPSGQALGVALTSPDAVTQAQVGSAYGQLPLSFEANQGQTDAPVNFLSRGSGYTLFLTPGAAVLDLQQGSGHDARACACSWSARTQRHRPSAWTSWPARAITSSATTRRSGTPASPTTAGSSTRTSTPASTWSTTATSGNWSTTSSSPPARTPRRSGWPSRAPTACRSTPRATGAAHGRGRLVEHAPVLYQESGGVRQAVSGRYVLEGERPGRLPGGRLRRDATAGHRPGVSWATPPTSAAAAMNQAMASPWTPPATPT